MAYRCEATSVAGFIQQLAVGYIAKGYLFYVSGHIPDDKDPVVTDRKIISQYNLDISRWTRARRKTRGEAGVQYLRFGRFFVLIATHGKHPFFAGEEKQVHDIRKRPLFFMGYSVGCRRARGNRVYHASVRIQQPLLSELKLWFERIAVLRTVEGLCRELRAIPYEAYAPVRDQLRGLLRTVNRRRKVAGLEPVPRQALWLHRVQVKPFAETTAEEIASPRKKSVRNRPWPTIAFDE